MKRIFLSAITAMVLAGCGGSGPAPAGRLHQPAGGFSYITPEGWHRTRLPGIEFIIVATDDDQGIRPNIFVDFAQSSVSLDAAVERLAEQYSGSNNDYSVLSQTAFSTASGADGTKITVERINRTKLRVASYHYVIADTDRTVAITCTCTETVKQKYEAVFDTAIRSLEFH